MATVLFSVATDAGFDGLVLGVLLLAVHEPRSKSGKIKKMTFIRKSYMLDFSSIGKECFFAKIPQKYLLKYSISMVFFCIFYDFEVE